MIKIAVIFLAMIMLTACGSKAIAPANEAGDAFTILSSSPDQAAGGITINIRIDGPLSQETARAAAETVIARNRNNYRNITVKSFAPGSKETDLPYTTSILQNGSINHKANPMAAPQKIPTH
jgi:hypothetical protein